MSDACAGCTGRCCWDVVVRVTGLDAWRIRRSQGLEYAQFVNVLPDDDPGGESFRIGDRLCSLYLAKNPLQPRACTFLMHLPGEQQRCGIYAERPLVCAAYPMQLRYGSVDLRSDVRCAPSDWNLATLDYRRWRETFTAYAFERAVFGRIATQWNELAPMEDDAASQSRFFLYIDAAAAAVEGMEVLAEVDAACAALLGAPLP
jgi:Fe-S-cluster containining protein